MQLRLTLRSDATFGRGDGVAGLVDTEVEHDFDVGLPFLRGRTLKGVLVEECANLFYALKQQGHPALRRLRTAAQFLFGAPGSGPDTDASLHIGRAQLPQALRKAVAVDIRAGRLHPDEVLDTLTALRHQTAVDDATGAPEAGSLRTARILLRETTFYAPLSFACAPANDALALLAACARALHRAGTARNRGRGRLRLRLYDPEADASSAEEREEAASVLTQKHFDYFKALIIQPDEADSVEGISLNVREADNKGMGEAHSTTLRCRIRLEQPVIATSVEGDPNSSVSFGFLPGSILRGALIARYLRERGSVSDLADDDEARRLFLDGVTRFLNAYPVVEDEYEDSYVTQPAPLSYHREKGNEDELHDFAFASPDASDERQWQRVGSPFLTEIHGDIHLEVPARHITVHTARDRRAGRAKEESGALFRYDALATGQTFEAVVRCSTCADADRLHELLDADPILNLGGSRSVDYGRARITRVERAAPTGLPPLRDDGRLVLVLQSDALVRDAQGQFTLEEEDVVSALNDRLDLPAPLERDRAFLRSEIVGGFNRKWNLPLPQARVVKRGSVLMLRVPEDAPPNLAEQLAALEDEGFGERRAEGFGQVAVNRHAAHRTMNLGKPENLEPDKPDPLPTERDVEAHDLALQMTERLLRRRLDLALVKVSGSLAGGLSPRNVPTPSQLARLRTAFRGALQKPNRSRERAALSAFLDDLPNASKDQLRVGPFNLKGHASGTLLKWLAERVQDTHDEQDVADLWDVLDVKSTNLPQIGETARAQRTDALAYEYNLRLAYAVLGRITEPPKPQQQAQESSS